MRGCRRRARACAARRRGATQKIVEVGASRTMPSGRTSSASSAPRRLGDPGRLHVRRVGERLDAGQDHAWASRSTVASADRLGVRRAAARRATIRRPPRVSTIRSCASPSPSSVQQRRELAPRARRGRLELDRAPPSAPAGRGARRARRAGRRRGGSPRRPRRRGRARRPAAGSSPRSSGEIRPVDACELRRCHGPEAIP